MKQFVSFENKNIIIFGASSGIGRQTVITLHELGASVILVGRDENELKETINLCKQSFNNTSKEKYYLFDLNEINLIEDLIKKIVSDIGMIDGMVYSAGINEDIPLKNLDNKRIVKTLNVNFFPFVECVRQVTMRGNYNKGMRIVGVSSVSSILGEKAHCAYSSSKAAMDGAIRVMAKELASKGIAINNVAPGLTKTKMFDDFIDMNGIDNEAYTRSMKRQYLGLALPEDVANVICFLLSNESRMITGVTLPVDGGFTTSC